MRAKSRTKYERIQFSTDDLLEDAITKLQQGLETREGFSLARSAALHFFATRGAKSWLEEKYGSLPADPR